MKFERSRTHKQINTCTEKWYAMNDFFFFWAGIHKCNLHRIISLNHHAICNDGLVLPLSGVLANILALFDIFFVYLFCYFFFSSLFMLSCQTFYSFDSKKKRNEKNQMEHQQWQSIYKWIISMVNHFYYCCYGYWTTATTKLWIATKCISVYDVCVNDIVWLHKIESRTIKW